MSQHLKKLFPAHIRNVAVTAPAGPPDAVQLGRIIKALRAAGIQVTDYMPQATLHTPFYLAGDREERLHKFNSAVQDPAVDMIICGRGGFGCVHLLDGIDYATLQRRKLPVMGYSDITSLHCAMLASKSGTVIAGSNLLTLDQAAGDIFSCAAHRCALDTLSGSVTLPEAPQPLTAILPDADNIEVSATAYAANLTVLASLCGTGFMPDFSDMILILEDVNEPLYKIDRLLNQLMMCGVFSKLKALVFGIFSGIEEMQSFVMLQKRIAVKLDCPCFSGFQFGHLYPMCAVNSTYTLTLSANGRIVFSN